MIYCFSFITNTIEKISGIEKLTIKGKGNNTVAYVATRASGKAFGKI